MSDTQTRHLEGNYAPVDTEVTAFDLPVTGAIPPELNGRLLRIGPNPYDGASGHWFAGTGMAHGVRIEDGRAAWDLLPSEGGWAGSSPSSVAATTCGPKGGSAGSHLGPSWQSTPGATGIFRLRLSNRSTARCRNRSISSGCPANTSAPPGRTSFSRYQNWFWNE